jgi:hypothetical protein
MALAGCSSQQVLHTRQTQRQILFHLTPSLSPNQALRKNYAGCSESFLIQIKRLECEFLRPGQVGPASAKPLTWSGGERTGRNSPSRGMSDFRFVSSVLIWIKVGWCVTDLHYYRQQKEVMKKRQKQAPADNFAGMSEISIAVLHAKAQQHLGTTKAQKYRPFHFRL